MASYQDIETRVRVIEDKLKFVMDAARMKAAVSSGVMGPDGQPVPSRVFEASLAELYQMSRQLPVMDSNDAEPPPTIEAEVVASEVVNG